MGEEAKLLYLMGTLGRRLNTLFTPYLLYGRPSYDRRTPVR